VIAALGAYGPVSVDTQKESVARAAVAAGASVLNDVSSTLVDVAGELGVGYVAMHRQGDSTVMQVKRLRRRRGRDRAIPDVDGETRKLAGVTTLWLDPGIGLARRRAQHRALGPRVALRGLARDFDAGVLIARVASASSATLGESRSTWTND